MKKAKRDNGSNSMDRISDLPKEILQKILYFLSQKDAVRTSILSKSWRYIWCTRPNLHFSDRIFEGTIQEFLFAVDKSLQQYCDQRLCLEEFHLSLSLGNYVGDQESVSLLEKWIPLLTTTMGVKEFHLSIRSNNLNVDLPSVVFKAEPLKLLDLGSFNMIQNIPEIIPFDRLQVLSLHGVLVRNEDFDKIISSCPLLTTMRLLEWKGFGTIKLEKKLHKYLQHFTFTNVNNFKYKECSIEIDVPTLETIKIIGSKIRFHCHEFINLKSLSLKMVEISSNSMEQSQLCIDAPNIERFHYTGFFIPSISFAPTFIRSNLELSVGDLYDAQSWFLRLSKLLQALRQSEISLNIHHLGSNNLHIQEDIINGGNKPVVVDHLEFKTYHLSSFPSFLNGLLCICRPRSCVSPCDLMQGYIWNKETEREELSEFICKIQKMGESGNKEIWQDLTIEGFNESRQEWQSLQVAARLSKSALRRVRLQWSDRDCASSSKLLEL